MNTLIHISYSPWSERARWALDVQKVPYVSQPYQPLIGEPALRLKTGNWQKNVTVPVLLTERGAITDSFDIAQFAAQEGRGVQLFPPDKMAQIEHFNALSERGLAAGRVLALLRVRENQQALLELAPKSLRKVPGMAAISLFGVNRTLRKYGAEVDAQKQNHNARETLEELRAALAQGGPDRGVQTLLGQFTYADITASQILAMVQPAASMRMGKANREMWRDAELAKEFADLVTWRDELYGKWRE